LYNEYFYPIQRTKKMEVERMRKVEEGSEGIAE
jgi:hypothetical protein